jgi:hypothetical protein
VQSSLRQVLRQVEVVLGRLRRSPDTPRSRSESCLGPSGAVALVITSEVLYQLSYVGEASTLAASDPGKVSNYLFLPLLLPLLPFPLLLLASALPLPGLTDLSLLSLPWPWSICCAGGSTAGETDGVSVVWVVA